MAILSKINIIRRIMIGEMLINPRAMEPAIRCLLNDQEAEHEFAEYFKKLAESRASDPSNLRNRKLQIKEYVKKRFFDNKTVEQIERALKQEIKDRFKTAEKFDEWYPKIALPIFFDYINPRYLKAANCDLSLGEDVYVTTEKTPRKLNAMGADGVVSIEPGEFGILMTHEYLFVPPDLMAFISIRLTHKQKGLVNISGFHVDPGYYGQLMFAVFNAGPNDVPLRYNEPVFMIMFNELEEWLPVKLEEGRWYGMENIPVETLSGLRGTSVSVRNLDERIKRLEMAFPVVVGGVVSVVIAVITWVLTHWG